MLSNLEITGRKKKFQGQPKLDEATGQVQLGCQRNVLNPIISKLDKHVVLLLIYNYWNYKKFQGQPKLDEATDQVQLGCQRNVLNPSISKLEKHVVLLLINSIASQLLGIAES